MYATSPDRYGFMIENYKKRLAKDPNNVEIRRTMEFYERCKALDEIDDPKENDLSYDLRKCEWVIEKCKKSEEYTQNLYAALCNNSFLKNENEWSCSWRFSAGLVSNLKEEGDYVDWYCSGIPADWDLSVKGGFVGEGTVTKEVEKDLECLGWILKKRLI